MLYFVVALVKFWGIKDMKKTTARWSCELWLNCPHCDEFQEIEFIKIDEWWCYFKIATSETELDYKHSCCECGKDFIVDSTEW